MQKKIITVALFAILMLSVVATLTSVTSALVTSKTYTIDADFDEGTLVGVEHETVHDQLQLSKKFTTLPFIWVPNNEGTVSKVDTVTGKELGRYWVSSGSDSSPSRTTVDLDGNCWVGCRQRGTVVKIGLYEAGQWIDRNGDGICQTSQDLNNDGDIDSSEILPWGKDECVLYEVVLIPSHEGTYAPGSYLGPYDTNYWGVAPRGLAIDAKNNLWAGTWSTSKYFYINGVTGTIIKTVDVSSLGHHAYGAVIDKNGVLWSASASYNHVLKLDPSTDPPTIAKIGLGHYAYGLGLDYLGHLFVAGWDSSKLTRINTATATIDWSYPKSELYQGRGVVCTSDNDVWVVSSWYGTVNRYDNTGNLKKTISVGKEPTGVAVDADGKVWVCNNGDTYIKRIDPLTETVDLSKSVVGSSGHYTYSDMTGIIVRTITTKIGTWTVIFDSEEADIPWGKISWSSEEPDGTSVTVKVRSSNDQMTWSAWETAINGVPLSATPNGRYLQIETTLQIFTGDVSPILYDLTVETAKVEIPVYVDIKPGSWPNPINIASRGVFAVAVCGTEDSDVMTIDPATVKIHIEGIEEGVSPIRWTYYDVATPYTGEPGGGHALMGDGYLDLVLLFDTQTIVTTLGLVGHVGETLPLIIMGNLYKAADGTPIKGQDYVWVLMPRR